MPLAQGNYTYVGEQAREVVLLPIVESTKLDQLHPILQGIKAKQQVAYLGDLDKITKLDAGCGLGAESREIPISAKWWDPQDLKVWQTECYTDTINTLFAWGQKNGIERADLTNTEYLDMVIEAVERAMPKDAFRIAWFAHKDAANIANGGKLKAGVLPTDYNQINGFWEQIIAIMTANPAQKVDIPENGAASKTAQLNLAADRAINVFEELLTGPAIDSRLIGDDNRVIYCTASLFNNYKKYLRSFPNIDASYERIEGRYDSLMFDGVRIISISDWDRIIRADFDNGTTYDLPHRAVLTTRDNLPVGVDASEALSDVQVFFDPVTELNHVKGGYKMDVMVAVDFMIAAAY
jgi:hypothetical protein